MANPPAKTPYSRANKDVSTELRLLPGKGKNKEKKPASIRPRPGSSLSPFPWLGAAALLSIVLLTAAAVAVLLASRNSPVVQWKVGSMRIQPQVWVSVLTTIMDGLTVFTLAKAAEFTYWHVLARGTTLRDMYDLYESASLIGAVNNLLHLRYNQLAFASVLCLVSMLRAPLFQRASVVVDNFTRNTSATLQLQVAQLIPPTILDLDLLTASIQSYDNLYDGFIKQLPIKVHVDGQGCGDHCFGKVKGYGFDIKCLDLTTVPWDKSEDSTVRQRFQDPKTSHGSAVPSFNSSASLQGVVDNQTTEQTAFKDFLLAEQRGWFDVVNLFKSEPICGGNLSISTCSLHHAVVEYDVTIKGGNISLSRDSWKHDKVLFQTQTWLPADIEDTEIQSGLTSSWVSWYQTQFNREISIDPDNDWGESTGQDSRDLLAKAFIYGDRFDINCNTIFGDPTQFVLNRLREMAFRTAVFTGNLSNTNSWDVLFENRTLAQKYFPLTQNWTQDVAITGIETIVVFGISIPYLACAIACSLSAVIAMVPLYWTPEKDRVPITTFNPLHVARVLDAPLLQDVHEEDIERYVRKSEGLRKVKIRPRKLDDGEIEVTERHISNPRDG